MSYILDALKKSDQQRQRGTTPTLPSAQATVSAPKQSSYVHYGVLAAVLLCAGIAIGWLYPWQDEQPARAAEPIAARPVIANTNQTLLPPRPDQVAMAETPEQKLPVPSPALAAPAISAKKLAIPVVAEQEQKLPVPSPAPAAPVVTPKEPAIPVAAVQEQKVTTLSELPLAIQHEIPDMKIQLHSYSNKSVNSIVSINSRMLKEGESLAPGLKLEQITPDGVILSYKGYRFQHGIW
jgi:general secretion pathway protein B